MLSVLLALTAPAQAGPPELEPLAVFDLRNGAPEMIFTVRNVDKGAPDCLMVVYGPGVRRIPGFDKLEKNLVVSDGDALLFGEGKDRALNELKLQSKTKNPRYVLKDTGRPETGVRISTKKSSLEKLVKSSYDTKEVPFIGLMRVPNCKIPN